MKFSVVTPSYNQLAYLKRCVASVADQKNTEVEHIVIDGGSTDGTVEWLEEYVARQSGTETCQLSFVSEADTGMYDALNKGVDRATGDVFSWLNCDEQYLPETCQEVAWYFTSHVNIDVAYGNALLVTPDGELLTFRKNPPLRCAYILADHLYVQSASIFFRAKVFQSGLRFNTKWKAVGDSELIIKILRAGFRAGQIRNYLSACVMSGTNLSCLPAGIEELSRFRSTAGVRHRLGRPILNSCRYFEKWLHGGYHQSVPFEYLLYTGDVSERKVITAQSADSRFKWSSDDS